MNDHTWNTSLYFPYISKGVYTPKANLWLDEITHKVSGMMRNRVGCLDGPVAHWDGSELNIQNIQL